MCSWCKRSSAYIHYLCYVCKDFPGKCVHIQYFSPKIINIGFSFLAHAQSFCGGSPSTPGGNLSVFFSRTLWSFYLIRDRKFLCGMLHWLQPPKTSYYWLLSLELPCEPVLLCRQESSANNLMVVTTKGSIKKPRLKLEC